MRTRISTPPQWAVAGIIIAELLACTLWFSVNAVAGGIEQAFGLSTAEMGSITAAVQVGFISGTLILGLTGLADRVPASRIMALATLLGAILNLAFVWLVDGLVTAILVRFLIGMCLAGIYPLGMKLIVSWSPGMPGFALGLLVGMLTLGTALPHGLASLGSAWNWSWVLLAVSVLALSASALVSVIGEGPFGVTKSGPIQFGAILHAFKIPAYRAAALGYFGHMWELYAFWMIVPWLVAQTLETASPSTLSFWSFMVIGIGTVGAIWAGWVSRRWGSGRVAGFSLAASALLCLLFPWIHATGPEWALVTLVLWGYFVIADSAQFSAVSAKSCAPEYLGSALAVQNSAGFAISVVSILWLAQRAQTGSVELVWWLLPGPILGLIAMRRLWNWDERLN